MAKSCKPVVLICDDEEGIRESFKLILDEDYDLRFASNGLEALDMLKTLNPSLMLLDIKMPKMHGLDILKRVKQSKPKLPVIIVTGYQSVEMAQEALKLGAADYIPKPFDSKSLQKTVSILVR
jgi:YesN/AraC family two-component response regulator